MSNTALAIVVMLVCVAIIGWGVVALTRSPAVHGVEEEVEVV